MGESSLHPLESGPLRQATVKPMEMYGLQSNLSRQWHDSHFMNKNVEINIQVSSISSWLIKLNPTFLISLSAMQCLVFTSVIVCSAVVVCSAVEVCSAGSCCV